ncbi:MAG: hypothetical protein HQL90_06380 [Magnetococcales bacterium]|nr:hypothetical protein [Magnetococcales bacterium]
MTAQIAEMLNYLGEKVHMCSNPLSDYFAMGGINPRFSSNCTALWRGYIGSWEIVGDRLYLIGLTGTLEDGSDVSLATIFPKFPERVFAHWYSGTIRIPQGKQLKYVHMGYGSIFERDLFLDVDRGVVVATRVHHNGTSKSKRAPEGYNIAAMTVFSRIDKSDGGAS